MTFIIAECGINWRNLDEADQMIQKSAEAGADAVKFQAYLPKEVKGHPRECELIKIILTEPDIRFLYWRCQAHEIEFMCTPDYIGAVKILNPYVKRWKVRFSDRANGALILRCAKTGKDILISGGNKCESPHMIPLYCCPEYPPAKEPEIFAYGNTPAQLQEAGYNGYSCHIPNWKHAAFAATHNDLGYLEVHVRLDKYEPPYCPIDTSVSITMSELAKLVQTVMG